MLKTLGCKKLVSVLRFLFRKWQEVDGVLQVPTQISITEKDGRRNYWTGAKKAASCFLPLSYDNI